MTDHNHSSKEMTRLAKLGDAEAIEQVKQRRERQRQYRERERAKSIEEMSAIWKATVTPPDGWVKDKQPPITTRRGRPKTTNDPLMLWNKKDLCQMVRNLRAQLIDAGLKPEEYVN